MTTTNIIIEGKEISWLNRELSEGDVKAWDTWLSCEIIAPSCKRGRKMCVYHEAAYEKEGRRRMW